MQSRFRTKGYTMPTDKQSQRLDLLAVILAEVTPAASGDDRSIATIFDAAATLLCEIGANTAGKVTHENGTLRSDYHTSREELAPYVHCSETQDELDRAKSAEVTR